MKIGLALPSILMAKRFNNRIFAPKDLYLDLVNGLVKKNEVYAYTASSIKTDANLVTINSILEDRDLASFRDNNKTPDLFKYAAFVKTAFEYEQEILENSFSHGKKEKIDLMHIYLQTHGSYSYDYLDFPIVTTLHDPVPPEGSIERLRCRPENKIHYIAISDRQKKEYEEQLGLKVLKRIYHGINVNSYSFNSKPNANYMVTMGRYLPEKGISDAIQASIRKKKLLKIASSMNFKENSYYLNKISPFLGSEFVQEFDFMSIKEKINFLGNAKAFLFPISWEEPFGMVMLEAMACGTPVIAYAQGSVPEIIKDGETGFIINLSEEDIRGDFIIKKTGIEGLIEAIERLDQLSNGEYERMRSKTRRYIEENFTVEKMVKEYEDAYKQIIDMKNQSS